MSILYYWGKPITTSLFQIKQDNIQQVQIQMTIKKISCGENYCLILNHQEQVYKIGYNLQEEKEQQQNGKGFMRINIKNNCKINNISCGWNHALLLDVVGNVYSSGNNKFGQLGRGKNCIQSDFQIVLSGVKQISAGKDHSLALIGCKVMGWGNPNEGQLGLLPQKIIYNPQQLAIYPCNYLYAGNKYSLFVTTNGVYGTGLNENFQLGLGHQKNTKMPRRINIEQQIIQINGGCYSVAKNTKSQWYIWGTGGFGIFQYPTKISILKGSQKISLANKFGALYQSQKLWVWGNNIWGQYRIQNQFNEQVHVAQGISDLQLNQIEFGGNFMIGFRNKQLNNFHTKTNYYNQSFDSQLFNNFKRSQECFEQPDQILSQDDLQYQNRIKKNQFLNKNRSQKHEQLSAIKDKKLRKYSQQLNPIYKSSSSNKQQQILIPKNHTNTTLKNQNLQKRVKLTSTIRSFYNNKYHFSQNNSNKSLSQVYEISTKQQNVENNYIGSIKQASIKNTRQRNRQQQEKISFTAFDQKFNNLKCIMEEICQ